MKSESGYSINKRHNQVVGEITHLLPKAMNRVILTEFLLDHANFWVGFTKTGKAEQVNSRQSVVVLASIFACVEYHKTRPEVLTAKQEGIGEQLKMLDKEIDAKMSELASKKPDFHKAVKAIEEVVLSRFKATEMLEGYIQNGDLPKSRAR